MRNQSAGASGGENGIRVLVVGEHALLRQGLVGLLAQGKQIEAVDTATSAQEILASARQFRPDVILADGWASDSSCVHLLDLLRTVDPEPKVILLSVDAPDRMLLEALRAGVRGLLDPSADVAQLIDSVIEVTRNETFVSKRLIKRLISRLASDEDGRDGSSGGVASLTERERQILRAVAAGRTNRAIAATLYLSEGTIRAHMRSIMRKLNAANRVQAATLALRSGLISPLDDHSDISLEVRE
jgi:DNA-binding NarL/FixJ family response regulator